MLTVGTGLGGGLIVDNHLYRGAFGIGAEFGHTRAVPEGHLCGCGIRGCFEQYASGNALLRHARGAIHASPDLAKNLLARGDGTIEGITIVTGKTDHRCSPRWRYRCNRSIQYDGPMAGSFVRVFSRSA